MISITSVSKIEQITTTECITKYHQIQSVFGHISDYLQIFELEPPKLYTNYIDSHMSKIEFDIIINKK